jgi:hypothetical protein
VIVTFTILGLGELTCLSGTRENMRKGFWSAVNSPELQADAKRIGLIVDPLDYKQTLSRLAELFKTPKSTIAKVKKTIRVK